MTGLPVGWLLQSMMDLDLTVFSPAFPDGIPAWQYEILLHTYLVGDVYSSEDYYCYDNNLHT